MLSIKHCFATGHGMSKQNSKYSFDTQVLVGNEVSSSVAIKIIPYRIRQKLE